jgi:hypothetical protein
MEKRWKIVKHISLRIADFVTRDKVGEIVPRQLAMSSQERRWKRHLKAYMKAHRRGL